MEVQVYRVFNVLGLNLRVTCAVMPYRAGFNCVVNHTFSRFE